MNKAIKLWFDNYNGPEHIGDFTTSSEAFDYMAEYIKNNKLLAQGPYYYRSREYKNEETGECGLWVDYGSHERFFRIVGGEMSDF